jgi:DNA-binding CsgD family transcriptional regulator/pimeloyl-ACP methyl ester carboxylesterase
VPKDVQKLGLAIIEAAMDAPPVQYVTTSDGFRIAYGVSGSGTPLLFLPGSFYHVQLAWQFPGLESWLRGLAERFQLIQLDPRGTGMSSRDVGEGHSRAHYQRDIEAVLQWLQPGPFLLLAASSGVDIAVDYALAHPENVTALLLGTSGTSKVNTPMFEMLPAADWEVFLYSIVPRTRSREEASKIVELTKQASDQRNFFLRRRVLYAPGEIEEALARLETPPLVMHARDYALTPVEEGMKIAQHSGGRLVLIDGADPWGDAEQGIRAIEAFLDEIPSRQGTRSQLSEGLSARELEVMRLLAGGKSNAQIADELVISRNTVRRHVSNIFDKTGVANRAQAAIYAKDHGLA